MKEKKILKFPQNFLKESNRFWPNKNPKKQKSFAQLFQFFFSIEKSKIKNMNEIRRGKDPQKQLMDEQNIFITGWYLSMKQRLQ